MNNNSKSLNQEMLNIRNLGPCQFESPILRSRPADWVDFRMTSDADRVQVNIHLNDNSSTDTSLAFEKAGAREKVFFNGQETKAAIVTCGGLCPGLNDVIRQLVMTLMRGYGVQTVYGIRYGYAGMIKGTPYEPRLLTPEWVENIHTLGGTVLGSSRGKQPIPDVVDYLEELGVNILFTIGGDGTLRGATAIADEVERRGLKLSVIGIPKTIDNDIPLVFKSFGFETAVEEAEKVMECAHTEAKAALNGVGLVKLMGRHAGFIAAMATRANGNVNYCFVPEVPVHLDGPNGFLAHLRQRLRERQHAVVVVAEGACQELLGQTGEQDKSGNVRFKDVGLFLKEKIVEASKGWNEEVNVKYFDPSYTIRSIGANGHDSVFCGDLARYAVHAGMAGKTAMLVGSWHGYFTHVPFDALKGRTRLMRPTSSLWRSVLNNTGQPTQWS